MSIICFFCGKIKLNYLSSGAFALVYIMFDFQNETSLLVGSPWRCGGGRKRNPSPEACKQAKMEQSIPVVTGYFRHRSVPKTVHNFTLVLLSLQR